MKVCIPMALLLGVGRSVTAAESPSQSCCAALAEITELEGKVYLPGSSEYRARLETYYSANSALEPWCMVMPFTAQDVSRIVGVISKEQCPFGMRSGSHSAWKGANGVDAGITVDFGYMNATTYNASTKTASIQPGSDWVHAYEALDPYGVTAVGGRASVVGVGGFVTGGGYSFHSNAHGFACDTVANFEVVLANGDIVYANENENSDLWKVLKGGSGNFGFVTRVDQYAVESNQLWGGFVGFDLAQRDAIFEAYIDFAENMHSDPASQLIVAMQYDGKQRLMTSILSNSDAIENAHAFDNLLSNPNTYTTLGTGRIADLVPQFTGATPLGLYAEWMTGLTATNIHVMQFIEENHAKYVDKMKAAAPSANFSMLVQFQPFTQSMVSHSLKSGGNILGLDEIVRDGPALNWLIVVTVDTAENQKKIAPLSLEYRDAINAYATNNGLNKDWEYLNYAYGDQDPLRHYGSENIAFLRRTSQKYDPHGVFQRLRSSGFKIPFIKPAM